MTSTFHIREGVVVNTTNGTVYDPHIDISFGGTIKSTTNAGACTFNHDFNNEGVAGHTGHTGTITITGTVTGCGEYLGGYSSFEPSTDYDAYLFHGISDLTNFNGMLHASGITNINGVT